MYLSRIYLNIYSKSVRRDLSDCHALHQRILSLFPEKTNPNQGAREEFQILFRLEQKHNTGEISIIIQSKIEQNFGKLPLDYLKPSDTPTNPSMKNIENIYNSLEKDLILRFLLYANPTKKVETQSKEERKNGIRKNGKRIDLRTDEEIVDWIRKKGEKNGFSLMSVKVDPAVPDLLWRPQRDIIGKKKIMTYTKLKSDESQEVLEEQGIRKITLSGVQFEGLLKITDLPKFKSSLTTGIGPGKAFGFGLLSIGKIS